MSPVDQNTYKNHYAFTIENWLNEFERDFIHAPNRNYFISEFQKRIMLAIADVREKSHFLNISEIDNQLELDDRVPFLDLVKQLCERENRDVLISLQAIAEIKALNDTWFIVERKKVLSEDTYSKQTDTFNKESENQDGMKQGSLKVEDHNLNEDRSTDSKSQNKSGKSLVDIFSDPAKFDYIKKQLISRGFCTEDPFMWIHQGKGNKEIICDLLYRLQNKRYYNLHTFPQPMLLSEVAQNTFGVRISISTFKKRRLNNHFELFDFLESP